MIQHHSPKDSRWARTRYCRGAHLRSRMVSESIIYCYLSEMEDASEKQVTWAEMKATPGLIVRASVHP